MAHAAGRVLRHNKRDGVRACAARGACGRGGHGRVDRRANELRLRLAAQLQQQVNRQVLRERHGSRVGRAKLADARGHARVEQRAELRAVGDAVDRDDDGLVRHGDEVAQRRLGARHGGGEKVVLLESRRVVEEREGGTRAALTRLDVGRDTLVDRRRDARRRRRVAQQRLDRGLRAADVVPRDHEARQRVVGGRGRRVVHGVRAVAQPRLVRARAQLGLAVNEEDARRLRREEEAVVTAQRRHAPAARAQPIELALHRRHRHHLRAREAQRDRRRVRAVHVGHRQHHDEAGAAAAARRVLAAEEMRQHPD
eukprot:Unigene4906_Nuclearia_a/m.15015 Unigene4906_Nuclearia_a/g.15015  ORF Unigene4906_Nuclearia_a/g.15015 Unigene4906_Nuclearia_a/m.15015 type:complete len:311 (-) Unigene4906_Nuclearia_a:15-947(-)